MRNTDKCTTCDAEIKSRDDKAAQREWKRNFPANSDSDKVLVCTDCFVALMLRAEKEGYHNNKWRKGYEKNIEELENAQSS